jgi:hypothetical protein
VPLVDPLVEHRKVHFHSTSFPTSLAYSCRISSLVCSSSSSVPREAMRPSSRSRIWSARSSTARRCETTRHVRVYGVVGAYGAGPAQEDVFAQRVGEQGGYTLQAPAPMRPTIAVSVRV